MDDIIAAVDDALPKFNRELIIDYPKSQVDKTVDFLSAAFTEAMKFLRGKVKYQGYRVLTPEERVMFEISTQKSGAAIAGSELQLVAYDFLYNEKKFTSHLYLPYMVEGQIIIKNTRYAIMHGITEKVFSRSRNGITVRVIRQPLDFWRNTHFHLESVVTGQHTNEFVIGTKLHAHKSKKIQATVIHYLICNFGFYGTLNRFGLSADDVMFSDVIDDADTGTFDYFFAKKQFKDVSKLPNGQVYMKVRRAVLEDPIHRKLIANILYFLTKWNRHSVEDLTEPTGTVYRVYLGEILYGGGIGEAMACSQADTHLFSVGCFLDPMTRDRLATFGIHVNDMWELLHYIFTELDRILVTTAHQDLYDKRITITDLFMIETFVSMIYSRIYNIDQNPNRLGDKELSRLVGLRANGIRGIARAPNVSMVGNSIINGNMLLSFGLQKIRLSGSKAATPSLNSPDARFHPSVAAVETLVGFSGSNVGVTGLINPFAEISNEGGIVKPVYAEIMDGLAEFLPYQG